MYEKNAFQSKYESVLIACIVLFHKRDMTFLKSQYEYIEGILACCKNRIMNIELREKKHAHLSMTTSNFEIIDVFLCIQSNRVFSNYIEN